MDQNRQKMTEKSEFREMRSFDLAIRRAYFKAKIRRNYAKNVVINRSVNSNQSPNFLVSIISDTMDSVAICNLFLIYFVYKIRYEYRRYNVGCWYILWTLIQSVWRYRSFVRGELFGVYRCDLTELKAENMKTK